MRRRRDVAEDRALGRDARPDPRCEVIGDADVPGQNDVVAQLRAAGDADAGHEETSLPDPHVVPHVDEIVELGSPSHHGVVYASPIDGELDPISTSSSMMQIPTCGIRWCPPQSER